MPAASKSLPAHRAKILLRRRLGHGQTTANRRGGLWVRTTLAAAFALPCKRLTRTNASAGADIMQKSGIATSKPDKCSIASIKADCAKVDHCRSVTIW
jgi:hypothetical protein